MAARATTRPRQGGRLASKAGYVIGGGVVLSLILAGGSAALATGSDGASRYRLATASLGKVEEKVSLSGSVESASKAVAAYAVSGTVATVPVKVGDAVSAGQALSTLDPSSLQEALDTATDAYNEATDTLNTDLESQTTGTGATTLKASGGGAGTLGAPVLIRTAISSSVQSALDAVEAAQAALLNQYGAAQPAAGAAKSAAADAKSACAAIDVPGGYSTVDDPGGDDISEYQKALAKANKTIAAADGDVSAIKAAVSTCTSAVNAASSAAAAADAEQAKLSSLASSLDRAVAALKQAVAASSAGSTPASCPATASPAPTPAATASPQATTCTCPTAQPSKQGQGSAECPGTSSGAQGSTPGSAGSTGSGASPAASGAGAPAGGSKAQAGGSSGTAKPGASSGGDSGGAAGGTGKSGAGMSGTGRSGSGVSGSGAAGGSGAGGSGSGGSGSEASSSGAASASQILADKAALTLAEANLEQARQNLELATLRSPIPGTVAAVALAKGDQVSAGSTTQVITIVGDRGYLVTASVPLAKIGSVKAGQDVSVTIAGAAEPVTGTVSFIDPVNSSSDSSTPAYEITVALAAGTQATDGAAAQLEIVTQASSSSVTVPTSALHRSGGAYTVNLFQDGASVAAKVEVGMIGADLAQVTKGVSAGDQVILADLDEPIATSSSSSSGLTSLSGGSTNRTMREISGGGPAFQGPGPAGAQLSGGTSGR